MNPSITPSISTPSSSATSWFSGIVRVRRTDLKMSSNSSVTVSASADVTGPVVRKNQIRGVLFKYGPNPIQVRYLIQFLIRSDFILVDCTFDTDHV